MQCGSVDGSHSLSQNVSLVSTYSTTCVVMTPTNSMCVALAVKSETTLSAPDMINSENVTGVMDNDASSVSTGVASTTPSWSQEAILARQLGCAKPDASDSVNNVAELTYTHIGWRAIVDDVTCGCEYVYGVVGWRDAHTLATISTGRELWHDLGVNVDVVQYAAVSHEDDEVVIASSAHMPFSHHENTPGCGHEVLVSFIVQDAHA